MIAGFEKVDAGSIRLDGEVEDRPCEARDQADALGHRTERGARPDRNAAAAIDIGGHGHGAALGQQRAGVGDVPLDLAGANQQAGIRDRERFVE